MCLFAGYDIVIYMRQDLTYGLSFILKNIKKLNLSCKNPDMARSIAESVDATSFTFQDFCSLFKATSQSKSEDFIASFLLYNKGIKLDMKSSWDETLLHIAAREGLVKTCEILLKEGLKANTRNKFGWMPLHLAAKHGSLNVIRLLLNWNASINAKDNNGKSPLHWAARNGHLETVQLLLDSGADINAKDKQDITPLHEASERGHLKVVSLLLNHGADVNAKDKKGKMPLHKAATNNHLGVALLLLDHKADMTTKNEEKKMSLLLVLRYWYLMIIRWFVYFVTNKNPENKNNKMPIDKADILIKLASRKF